ncbi:MAG: efflux RND transporter permease subunit [Xanthomonadales bacterium]|nr:efflux RND transporter permease subunit [Xanthomonadales bacterium]MBP6078909.1 efflux RND transporter permease subunit [Xanthomonadales bacterium]MBP7623760.1 efflux RND transporter permease subunit [Xanthomonadales bacterium]
MSLVDLSLRRPVTTVMAFISLVVVGLLAAVRLPLEFLPEIDAPFLFIQVPYAGSTPEEVERSIARPAEEVLATLSGIKRINSNSRADAAEIFIEFRWDVDIAIKAVEARDRLEAARDQMPSDVRRFFVFKFSTADQAVLSLRISSGRDLSNAYDLLDRKLKRPLERLPGIARVELQGVQPPEVQIELNADRISAHGIDLASLNARLASSAFSTSGGVISDGDLRYRVQPIGEIESLEAYRNLVIDERGLRLRDIADVRLRPRELDYERRLDMRPAVAVEIFKERGANLVDVGRRALAEVHRIGEDPDMQGIDIFFMQDQAEGVTSSLNELAHAGIIGLLLSVLVLYLFLRHWASTLMVTLAIPICFAMTLGFMYFAGVTLNILSMMGLLLGVGMVVDNAVVAVESIYQQREKWPNDPIRCASVGVKNVTIAISAGTLCHCVVFLPNIFGEPNFISLYLKNVAITITISLLASWLVAISLIPMISARIETPKQGLQQPWVLAFRNRYARAIDWTLHHRGKTMAMMWGLLLLSFVPVSFTKTDMFPSGETREMRMQYELNGIYRLDEVRKGVEQVERYLLDNKEKFEITSVYSYFDERGNAQTSLVLTDDKVAKKASSLIQEEIRAGLPKLAIGSPNFGQGRRGGSSDGLQVSLIGESSELLDELAPLAREVLAKVEGVRDVKTGRAGAEQEIQVRVDRERALRYGFSAEQVAQFIGIAMRGANLREFRHEGQEVPVSVRFQGADSQSIDDLRGLRIKSPSGELVPLMSLVDARVQAGPAAIGRTNRQTAVQLQLNLGKDAPMEQVRPKIEAAMNALSLPAGYRWSFGGGFSDDNEAGAQMGFNTLLALLMIFIVMAAVFESLLYPVAILTSILFSYLGMYWLFAITGTTFSLMAGIGFLILMGVVVNNGIVMVEHINQLREEGLSRHDALVQGSRDRLRPVLMTMATTILGMLPLCIGSTQVGGDGPPYFPMARAIVGGLIFSTIITLLVLPAILAIFDDWRIRSSAFFGRAIKRGRLTPEATNTI